MQSKHDGTCPCGCGEEVPHGRFYYSDKCGVKYRSKVGKHPCHTGKRKIEQMQRRENEARKIEARKIAMSSVRRS